MATADTARNDSHETAMLVPAQDKHPPPLLHTDSKYATTVHGFWFRELNVWTIPSAVKGR